MVGKAIVTKYNVKNLSVYAMLEWKENETDLFHIKIYDGNHCWAGRFSNEFAKKFTERAEESEKEYRENVKTCLTKPNDNNFVYELTPIPDNQNAAKFTWKKKFDDSVKIEYGSVPVHRDDACNTKDALIDLLLQENKDLQNLVENYELSVQMLSAELVQSKNELHRFIDAKSSMENTVYGKFIHLLNSKKRRIQLLEENLDTMNNTEVD